MTSQRAVTLQRALLIIVLVGWAALFTLPTRALAADPAFPELTSRLVDQARIIVPENEVGIVDKLARLEAQTGDQFVVVTVDSLQGYEIEDFGYRLGRHWGIGKADNNGGVLLIIAPNERKVRLEVGYGLEPILTDAMSNHIIQTSILPALREGGYVRGINAGVDAVIAQLTLDPVEAQARAAQITGGVAKAPVFPAIVIALIFVFFFLSLLARVGRRSSAGGRRRRGVSPVLVWGATEILSGAMRHSSRGSGGGGGFGRGGRGGGFSGGGGSFGGGGASGGW